MRSNFICICFIGIVFDAVWLQRLCFFQTFLISVCFKKSFFTKIIIKTNLLFYLVLVLQFCFCGFAFLPHLFSFASLVSLFAAASLLWFRFLPLFPVPVSRVQLLRLCLSCFFCLFLLLCFFCRAFPALFSRAQKVLKNVLKIFMVWRSLYRGHILTIFILILSNLIQKIKTQFIFFLDFCCF